ncbi:hypothetical protein CF392_15955 [Tamilnaduibacter salinus]|uniref:Glycosyltransferase involved in cell wall biosynthesis n=1 Tax=Tamilnaduibacter salinus TaxID=1484056 RepID=A0A2A2HZM8_9GAMM|nr:glycosyltransferase [Tamilnaduibacter salinus]PAV24496.1 hypothetical protein CF392_15955 [Tamilnaduibacter salinus]
MHYPKLLHARRAMIGFSARKVYVTDAFLLPLAREHLKVDAKKLSVVTFGVDRAPGNDVFSMSLIERIRQARKSGETSPLIGLCATAVAQKCWHIFQMEHVLENLNGDRVDVLMVLICDVRRASDPKIRSVLERLQQRSDVIMFPEGGMVSELHLRGYVDFIYRSLTDQSIPYTLYNAAEAGIPILTHDIGLTAPLVRSFGIGVIWEELISTTKHVLEQALAGCSEHGYRQFLAERNWERGAAALAEGVAPHSATQDPLEGASVVHICNNYTSSKVHALIAENMAAFFERQTFIIPVRTRQELQVAAHSTERVTLKPVFFRNSVMRFFPLSKAFFVFLICFRHISESFEVGKEKFMIAHNFWSDGIVAFLYSLFRSAGYTLVVRNTDINIFIPKLPYYRWLMKLMVARARALVFVSEAHRRLFAERFPRLYYSAQRVEVIPNGISDFWLGSEVSGGARLQRVCYVGRFNKNKNLGRLLAACEQLLAEFASLELVMAGGDESELERVLGRPVPAFVRTLGVIEDDRELRNVYQSSRVFAMPSLTETFGLVYLEALSQGCAVVCTELQGIDGMFDLPYVRSVDPLSVDQIREAIGDLLAFENGVGGQEMKEHLQCFSWRRIGQVYSEVVL